MGGSVDSAKLREIVSKIRARDEHGLRLWWELIGPKLAGALAALFGHRLSNDIIETAVADTLTAVWYGISSFDNGQMDCFEGWCLKVGKNKLWDVLRGEKRHWAGRVPLVSLGDLPDSELSSDDSDKGECRERERFLCALRWEIEQLTAREKAIIAADLEAARSRRAGGRADAKLLAEELKTTKETIYVTRYRARRRLRVRLERQGFCAPPFEALS